MKHLKLFFALFAMLALGVGNAWGESVVFLETFGTTTSTPAYNNYTGYSATKEMFTDAKDVNTHYSGSGKIGKSNYAAANLSSGYNDASGLSGCWHTGTANTAATIISISNINIQNYEDLTLSLGALGGSTSHTIDVTYSIDGGAEVALITAGSITNKNWKQLSQSITQTGQSLTLNIKHKPTKKWTVRLDDIKITGALSSGSGSTESDVSVTDEQLKWSATTATALKGADNNEFPTLTNALGLTVTYDSSNKDAATIAADGKITLLAPGITTISAIFAGGEVSGTKYAAKTVTYTLTVKQLVSCADIYNLADDATFVLKDFVVTYVNGKYTYIKDDTGYGLIYKDSYGLIAGDQVASGKFEGKRDSYNSLVEIIPTTAAVDLHATNGTAPEPELMATNPIAGDMNKYVKFENVSFASTAFSSKSINGTIEGQGSSIKFYDQFTTNKTFDTSKKYDVIGVVSMFNSVQVNFISAEEVAEPTLNLTTTPIDFGKVAINSTNESTLQLSGSLLTKDITLSVEGDSYFTVSPNSITPSEGSVNETITITYKPIAEGTHTATLKITSDDVAEQTITLTGQAVQQHTVHFFVNGEEQTDLAKKVLSGNTLEELPTATSCDLLNYPTFAGWTTAEIDGTTDVKPTMLDLSTPITSDCNYYAVFAKGTTSSGTANASYELVLLPSHFTTSYSERSFTATANEVDGEGTLEVSLTSAGVMKNTDASKGNPIQFRKNSSSTSPGTIYNTTDLGQINSISYADGTNNIASTIIGASQQPTEQEDGKGFFMITNGTSVSYIPSITINFTKTSVSEITTYEYITSCAVVVPTCEITYDFAGGEGECTNDIVEEGAEYTLCATAPTKAGHTFLNWKDQHGTEYAAGATINSVTEDLTLTAQWQVNSYSVTWMSLGDEVLVNSTNYNTQPTKPATDPAYTCGTGKEFVGWTTQEIDGVGVPANLYTDEFPVVTEAITYYAVFAGKSAEASITTNTLTITENLGQYGPGTMTDDQGATWNYYAGGSADLTVNLRNNNGEVSYLASPKFAGTVQSITAHIKNGSSSTRKVYLRSSAEASPSGGDLGETSIEGNNNSNVTLVIADGKSFDQFYIQVSGGLQFKDIVVTSGIAAGAYVDFITSCDAVTASISVENITMEVGENKTITATVEPAEAKVTYTIKENAADAISLSGNTITALKEGTATITATVAEGATYLGNSVDFTVTVSPKAISDEVVILAQLEGQWYAMTGAYVTDKTNVLAAIPVEYFNGTLYNVEEADKASIEWQRSMNGNKATFKNGDKYLTGGTSTELTLKADAFEWDYNGVNYLCNDGKRTFLYCENTKNNVSGFKNFAISNAGSVKNNSDGTTESYSSFPTVTAPVYATGNPVYTRTVTNKYGTICLPYASASTSGAYFYEVVGKGTENGKPAVYLASVDALEAGVPYIFEKTANTITVTCQGEAIAEAGSANGLVGNFTNEFIVPADNYILYKNAFIPADGTTNKVNAYRAYLNMNDVTGGAPVQMPGRRYIGMSVQGENEATGFDNIQLPNANSQKLIINGQLIIIRDGIKYNAQGQKL